MESDSDGCISFGLIVVCVAGVLAMIVTWVLVARYPIPNDDATHLGLLGFFFVMFLDAFFIYRLILPEFRKGDRIEAAKWLVGMIALGLLVAAVVGSLLWLTRWIPDEPWTNWILWLLLALVFIPDIVRLWKKRRSRRASP